MANEVRIPLTDEQKAKIKAATGRDVPEIRVESFGSTPALSTPTTPARSIHAARSLYAAKATRATKAMKATKATKAMKATRATKAMKATKATKAMKATKATKAMKATKATKAV